MFLVFSISWTSLVKCIPKYFILFDAIIDGIIFLISFSDCSLIVYRNKTDFYMLILCTADLLKFTSANGCFIDSLGLPHIRSCHLQLKIVYIFLSNLDEISSCLIALARTSSTMLNSSRDRDIRSSSWSQGQVLSLSTLSMMLL